MRGRWFRVQSFELLEAVIKLKTKDNQQFQVQ